MASLGDEASSCGSMKKDTLRKRKRKEKKRQWIWTIGADNEDNEDDEVDKDERMDTDVRLPEQRAQSGTCCVSAAQPPLAPAAMQFPTSRQSSISSSSSDRDSDVGMGVGGEDFVGSPHSI